MKYITEELKTIGFDLDFGGLPVLLAKDPRYGPPVTRRMASLMNGAHNSIIPMYQKVYGVDVRTVYSSSAPKELYTVLTSTYGYHFSHSNAIMSALPPYLHLPLLQQHTRPGFSSYRGRKEVVHYDLLIWRDWEVTWSLPSLSRSTGIGS